MSYKQGMKPDDDFFLSLFLSPPKHCLVPNSYPCTQRWTPFMQVMIVTGVYLILQTFTSRSGRGFFTDSKAASQFTFSCSWLGRGKKGKEKKIKKTNRKPSRAVKSSLPSHDIPKSDFKAEFQARRSVLSTSAAQTIRTLCGCGQRWGGMWTDEFKKPFQHRVLITLETYEGWIAVISCKYQKKKTTKKNKIK